MTGYTETKKFIKDTIEKTLKDGFKQVVVVFFVDDIETEWTKIRATFKKPPVDFIPSETRTGCFMPPCEGKPGYIFIKNNDSGCEFYRTAFHELQHAIDFFVFWKLFDNNSDALVNSKLYPYFMIYTEYNATYKGYYEYLKIIYPEAATRLDITEQIDFYYNSYTDTSMLVNKFQYVNHTLNYLARIKAFQKLLGDEYDINESVRCIDDGDFFLPLFNCMQQEPKDLMWYEEYYNKLNRYINGGTDNE